MKILVVGAHPDDIEIGCGGTVLKFLDEGHDVDLLILVKPSNEVNVKRNETIINEELFKSSLILKHNFKIHNTQLFENGRPNLQCNVNVITEIENLLNKTSYDLMIIPCNEDTHKDHKTAYEICMSYARHGIKEIWEVGHPLYSHNYQTFVPNLFVNIEKYFTKKLELLNCYSSYLDKNKIDEIIRHNIYYGRGIPAETFKIIKKYI